MFTNQNNLSLLMPSMHSGRNLFRPKVQGMDILGYWKSQELFQRVYCKKHLQKRASIMKTRPRHGQDWAVHFWLNVFVRKSNETALGT